MMSAKWSWVFGIATVLGLALGIVFFVASQQVTPRDWTVLVIGALVGAGVAAFIATFLFHSPDRQARREAAAGNARKKAELVEALPTRKERLKELRAEASSLQQQIATAKGNHASASLDAQNAHRTGLSWAPSVAADLLANAEGWRIERERLEAELADLAEEQERLEAMGDEDYLAEQKHLKGLD